MSFIFTWRFSYQKLEMHLEFNKRENDANINGLNGEVYLYGNIISIPFSEEDENEYKISNYSDVM